MTNWTQDRIIHVDLDGDRERASDDYSRYGSYVGGRELSFQDSWAKPELKPAEPIAFASAAWEVACPPIMSPGLVDWRPDLHKVRVGYDDDGANLMVTVQLPLQHHQLAAKIPYEYEDWNPHNHWRADDYVYLMEPGVRKGKPTVTALVTIQHILTSVTLVTPPAEPTGRALVDACLQSVELTAAAINAELPEIINAVQGAR